MLTSILPALVVGSDLKLLHEAKVDFDADFGPKYKIQKGVLTNPDEGEVFAPVALFLDAIDLVLSRLKEQGVEFAKVKGISGAGMQHGTVFWSQDAEKLLGSLDPGESLIEQLVSANGEKGGAFSHPYSPNWQDASTQTQCEGFDVAVQGPKNLADATGSSAHHVRFLFSPYTSHCTTDLTMIQNSASAALKSNGSEKNTHKHTKPHPASPSSHPS